MTGRRLARALLVLALTGFHLLLLMLSEWPRRVPEAPRDPATLEYLRAHGELADEPPDPHNPPPPPDPHR